MKKEEKKPEWRIAKAGADMQNKSSINTDPFGSYTGVCSEDKYEIPVQDADDL